jgi:hypothetical protein
MFSLALQRSVLALVVAFPLWGSGASRLLAQADAPRAQVLLAISDSFPYRNADAVIIRRPGETPSDLILVKRDKLRPSLLAEGIVMLEIIRKQFGDAVTSRQVYRIPDPKRTNKYQNRAAQWSRSLMADRPKKMRGIGFASSMVVVP